MLFNSISYAVFLIVVFFIYWFVANKSFRAQNAVLLISSYVFYGVWDWRFLFLLSFSTALDYFTGLRIHRSTSTRARRTWLLISVVINLGFLCFFKYFNFFIGSFSSLLHKFDLTPNVPLLSIILPVGISFYTFHGLSYVFDIYNKRISPTANVIDYSLFVSFFPLLVAGPIERATHLLPQVSRPRVFDAQKASDGMRQILWGLFKKIVIADNCAVAVNEIFANPQQYSGGSLAFGAALFAFQIYGDFSGYTDIALGSARLLGFDLLRNFSYPYFSRDIAEFWKRWHISLTSWFKDYVYIPLGGNRLGKIKTVINTFIVFLLSGVWHGANWTFIVWGLYHALLFMPLLLLNAKKKHAGPIAKGKFSFIDLFKILITFVLVTIGWIIFRADNLSQAWLYFTNMIHPQSSTSILDKQPAVSTTIFFIALLVIVEWFQRHQLHGLYIGQTRFPKLGRYIVYSAIIICLFWFGGKPAEFIYFQF
jgi:alginate O-acetyltransferase complex protein AlgI